MRGQRLFLTILLGILLIIGPTALPALSDNQGQMGEVSPSNNLSGKYPQIVGVYPHKEGNQFFTYRRPPRCQVDKYCDSLEFDINKPDSYTQLYTVEVRLTWTAPNNDLDVFIWPDDDPALGGPVAQGANRDSSGLEVAQMGEPDSGHLWLTVVNHNGVNSGGYEVEINWEVDKLPPLNLDSRPGGRGGFGSSSASSGRNPRAFADFGDFQEGAEPQVATTPVMVPGPDGEFIEMDLPVYVESEQANPSGPNLLIPAAIIAGVVGIAIAVFFYRRARQHRIEEALSP